MSSILSVLNVFDPVKVKIYQNKEEIGQAELARHLGVSRAWVTKVLKRGSD
ncbi:MAG: hypothetical protein ACE5D0_09220 [Fidelibacterota bacterium]